MAAQDLAQPNHTTMTNVQVEGVSTREWMTGSHVHAMRQHSDCVVAAECRGFGIEPVIKCLA